MEASVIIQILCTVWFCLTILTEGQTSGKLETQFKNPLGNFPLLNIEFDHQTGNVFVSGMNVLYRFSMNGTELIQKMTRKTGPVADCLPQLSPKEIKEYCGDDYNTAMVVTPDSLITCGTLKGGLCMRRDKESLNITSTSPNVRLVSDEQASASGIFLNITDKNSPVMFQNIVLFAKQYTTLPLSTNNLEEAAIFSALPDLSAVNIGSSKFGEIFDMILRTPKNVEMDYRVVIENDKFVFLLVNQNSQSKLVKICKSIDIVDPKKVYEDIPISCYSEGTNLTHVKHGTFITVSGKRYLVGLFSSSNPTLSAVCVFEENEIYEAFLESRIHRYGCPSNNDLPAGDIIFDEDEGKSRIKCVPYRDVNETNKILEGLIYAFIKGDYCNNITREASQFGIIVGLLPLKGNAVYTKSHQVTVVGSSTINNLTNLYIGTNDGYVIQVFYDAVKKKSIELRHIKVDNSEIRAVRNLNGETFFMSQNKIVKLLQETQCGKYSNNCQQCMDVRDANCGWCVTSNRCTSKMECASVATDYWFPSVKNQCLSLEFMDHPSGYAYKLDDTRKPVTLSVTFVPPLETNENMTCRLGNRSIPKDIAPGQIQCKIPEETERILYKEGDIPLQILLIGNVIAERKILFYRCRRFFSCGKCIEQERTDCYWCTEEALCKTARGSCLNIQAIFKPQTPVSDCPQILSQTVSIASGQSRTLEFTGKKLSVPETFMYRCYVDGSGPYIGRKIPGTNNIQCLDIKTEEEGSKSVEIKYGPSGNVPLEVFNGVVALNVMAKRFGEENGESELPYNINCTNEALVNASSLLDGIIENVTADKFSIPETVNNTLQLMKHLTSSTNKISACDLNSSLDVLDKIVTVINATGSAIQKEVFYAVIENILSPNNSNAWTIVSEKTEKDPSFLLKIMDRFSKITLKTDNITAMEFIGSNFELIINQAKLDETGIRFPDENSNNFFQGSEKISTFLELPKQVSNATKAFNYVAVLYKTMSDILGSDPNRKELTVNDLDKSKRKTLVNSQILSLTTQTDLGVLDPPLNLMFGHKKESPKNYAACVSWDFNLNKWSEDGCTVKQTTRQRTLCHCNHLTNFAILMRPYTPVTEDSPFLKTMSLVGVVLSIAFTFLTSLIYVLIWRFIKSDLNILKLNMCGSLILSYAMFISFVETTSNEGVCVAITAIIHYLFLVTFFSMLGLGVYYFMGVTVTYYALYVANNFKSKSRVCWFLGGIWGIPVIITVTNLGAFWGQGYHLKSYCWLSIESGSLYLFIIPVCLICLINILIIVSLLRVLFASSIMAKSSLQKKASSGLRSLGTLLPVLGVTWLFGILVVNEKAVVFQYLFVVANSLQGFFIFVLHVLLDKKVRHGIGNKYPSLSAIFSFAEQGTKETNLSLQSPSTSKSNTPMMKPKKKSLLKRFRQTETKESKL